MKSIFLRFLKKTGIITSFNLFLSKRFNGNRIIIPILQGVGINNYLSAYEPWMNFIIVNLTKKDLTGAFIDIGANIGQTLIKLKSANPSVPYIGFEPNPACNQYLAILIDKNKFVNTKVFPIGISIKTQVLELKFYNNDSTDSSASMVENFRPSSIKKTLNIPVFAFNELDVNVPHAAIIKIDVEGAELEVITSLMNKLKSDRPIVLLEILPAYNAENEVRLNGQKQIETILSELGYIIFRVIKQNSNFKNLKMIPEFGIHSDLNQCDYVLSPKEKAEWLKNTLPGQ